MSWVLLGIPQAIVSETDSTYTLQGVYGIARSSAN